MNILQTFITFVTTNVWGIIAISIFLMVFAVVILYSSKVLQFLLVSRKTADKAYYSVLGKKMKALQTSFSRTAQLNKGTFIYKVYHFFDDIILNLDMKKDNVTVTGLIFFIVLVSLGISIVATFLLGSWVLIFPLFAALVYLIITIMRFIGLVEFEKREMEIMDAEDLMISDIQSGVYNAILKYTDSFHANIRPYFVDFIDDIQNKGYSFKEAMGNLNDKLGYVFSDFAQKAIVYEEKADLTMADIFSSILETNRQRRTLREINNIKFAELRTQFIVSCLIILGYAIFSIAFDPFIFRFFSAYAFGKMVLIADIVIIAFVLSYLVSVKSKAL